jgi:hypothetical protein
MHFFRNCGGSSVLVRQPGQSSCAEVHSGSPRGASGTPDRLTSEKITIFSDTFKREK